VDALPPGSKVVDGPGEYEVSDVFITGIGCFHDVERGAKRGKNTIYLIEMDELAICHLGDVGHVLSSQQVEELGDIDVLMLPVGGVSTIDAGTAARTVRMLGPRIVIPMHFGTELVTWLDPVDGFLKEMGIKDMEPKPKLSITKPGIPGETQVVLLDYHR
jgi:L-ascorbate metabolism protein UlaG (beta-lactamase superfamily)